MKSPLLLRVERISAEAKDVLVIELRDPQGGPLPAFDAGAHLELSLPNGMIRHYSLCNAPAERDRYCIGVGLARDGRGGSAFIHGGLRVGELIKVRPPRNNFPLDASAKRHDFVAGGIGITPMMAMIRHCEAQGTEWSLTYLVRSRQRAAFLEELAAYGGRVHIHADDESDGFADIPRLIGALPNDSAIYCCGPAPLMLAVEAEGTGENAARFHFEWFTAKEVEHSGPQEGLTLTLAKSGRSIIVPPDRSILEAMEDSGIDAPFACREGICGSCEMNVISGIPDHRDQVLSATEQASNKTIMICCSRALSDELVLDF